MSGLWRLLTRLVGWRGRRRRRQLFLVRLQLTGDER